MKVSLNQIDIEIELEIVDKIKDYYSRSLKYETGGILLGKINRPGKKLKIIEIYEMKSSFFSRVLYKRKVKKAQKIINRRWKETDGLINYVGEWHTHPGMKAIPSYTDQKSLHKIHMQTEDVLPGAVMLIAGDNNEIAVVVEVENKQKIIRLDELYGAK